LHLATSKDEYEQIMILTVVIAFPILSSSLRDTS
jgi:hypothetical protein